MWILWHIAFEFYILHQTINEKDTLGWYLKGLKSLLVSDFQVLCESMLFSSHTSLYKTLQKIFLVTWWIFIILENGYRTNTQFITPSIYIG